MNQAILDGFEQASERLACPLCGGPLTLAGTSLRCLAGHCFDIARQGYANLLPAARQQKNYDRASFENRHRILEGGFYTHVLDGVMDALAESACGDEVDRLSEYGSTCSRGHGVVGTDARTAPITILDAGCGEGYYALQVARALRERAGEEPCAGSSPAQVIAIDISKPSIQLAAKSDPERTVRWLVGDLANLPVRDHAVDCILDIFSPANYGEFRRVLRPGGRLIKVVPGANHLIELRERARGHLRRETYSNARIKAHLQEHFTVVSEALVSRTLPVAPQDLEALIKMAPLLFNVDLTAVDWSGIDCITIEAEVIVAR